MFSTYLSNKVKWFLLFLFFIGLPIVIFYYFKIIKTSAIYGDDLNIFMAHAHLKTFAEKISLSLPSQKYRPIHDIVLHFIIILFQKHVGYYYLFNIGIQCINTFLFAGIINLFLKSTYLTCLFSLLIAFSRFVFFNLTQLYNGGALEGLAMSFFFLSLYFLLKVLISSTVNLHKIKFILWSILFANLAMYTHERYLVMIPFIIFVILLLPTLKDLKKRQKSYLILLALLSLTANVVIKKYVYLIPFFVGTAGTNISISFSSVSSFFLDGVLSILEINSGPDYLVGIQFSNLSLIYKLLVLALVVCFLLILVSYFYKIIMEKFSKNNNTTAFISLIFLFGLSLAPAIVTIRLEQRWLQASFSIFVLLIVIAVSHLEFKSNYWKNLSLTLFIILFLSTDAAYLYFGYKNVYMSNASTLAKTFKEAIDYDVIHSKSSKIFLWQNSINDNNKNTILWILEGGDFFDFYENKSKKIVFVDSVYQKRFSKVSNPLSFFNKNEDQILFIDHGIVDITNDYLKDTLKSLNPDALSTKVLYNQQKLIVNHANLNEFVVAGLYQYENGIAWTNGNVNIKFLGNYLCKDTVKLKLNTFMPPICKNIFPKITLSDINNNIYPPIYLKQEGNIFYYIYYFPISTTLQKVNITSELINAAPDIRILSFPFISLEITH